MTSLGFTMTVMLCVWEQCTHYTVTVGKIYGIGNDALVKVDSTCAESS